MLHQVRDDVFRIGERLLHINKAYRVFWNNFANRYEVHTKQLEFVVPYDCLDSRTLELARKSRKQNADAIERELERHNDDVACREQKRFEIRRFDLEDMLAFAMRKGSTIRFNKDFKEF